MAWQDTCRVMCSLKRVDNKLAVVYVTIFTLMVKVTVIVVIQLILLCFGLAGYISSNNVWQTPYSGTGTTYLTQTMANILVGLYHHSV